MAGAVTVRYATFDGSAIAGLDYLATNGSLTFAANQSSTNFLVRLIDNSVQDGNRTLQLALFSPTGGATLGAISNALLTIVDDESINLPAGSVDPTFLIGTGADQPIYSLALQSDNKLLISGEFATYSDIVHRSLSRINPGGDLDTTFDIGAGFNDQLRALVLQPDGRVVVGGLFTNVSSVNRSHVARLNIDGSLDTSFNPGAGSDNPIFALALQPDGRVLIGGSFTSFNGVNRPNLARLNTNGTLNLSFNVGTGPNGVVYAIAVQNDGRILIGGDFTAVNNNTNYHRLARLNVDGSLDTSFVAGTNVIVVRTNLVGGVQTLTTNWLSEAGADAPVRSLLVQPDGMILVGGSFTNFAGTGKAFLVRLFATGKMDNAFMADSTVAVADRGPNEAVYALALQADQKILAGGAFTRVNGVTRNSITRLNLDGTTDPSINFGLGANGFVAAIQVQPDRKIVLGGGFTSYDGKKRNHLVRIYGGSIQGNGTFEFDTPFYSVLENQPVVMINVVRRGHLRGRDRYFSDSRQHRHQRRQLHRRHPSAEFPPGRSLGGGYSAHSARRCGHRSPDRLPAAVRCHRRRHLGRLGHPSGGVDDSECG